MIPHLPVLLRAKEPSDEEGALRNQGQGGQKRAGLPVLGRGGGGKHAAGDGTAHTAQR